MAKTAWTVTRDGQKDAEVRISVAEGPNAKPTAVALAKTLAAECPGVTVALWRGEDHTEPGRRAHKTFLAEYVKAVRVTET